LTGTKPHFRHRPVPRCPGGPWGRGGLVSRAMKELRGRVAAITGAGSGIGRALAEALAEEGTALALSDVDEEGLAETAARTAARVRTTTARVDVADRAAVFAWAVYRLGGRGMEAIQGGLDWREWTALVALTVGFVYGEGVRALDRRWIPALVDRARRLPHESRTLQMLAPLYGLGLVGSDRGELLRGWLTTFGIVVAVLVIKAFPSPWRGIVDFAVAAALAWGCIAILRRVPAAVR